MEPKDHDKPDRTILDHLDSAALTHEANEKWQTLNEGHNSRFTLFRKSCSVPDARGPYDQKSADTTRYHLLG